MGHEIHPALVLGVGTQGKAIAGLALQEAQARFPDVPVLCALTISEPPIDLVPLKQALDTLYQIELQQKARTKGWEIRREDGVAVFLIVPVSKDTSCNTLAEMMACLSTLAGGQTARNITLNSVLLMAEGTLTPEFLEALQAAFAPIPFLEACYLIEPINNRGLTFSSEEAWQTMIAEWILELLCTPLGSKISGLPATNTVWLGSFGLAHWQFPRRELLAHLTCRYQKELLNTLLATPQSADEPTGALAILHEECAPPSLPIGPGPQGFSRRQEIWSQPGLQHLTLLREEIDAAAAVAAVELEQAAAQWSTVMDTELQQAEDRLLARISTWLDLPLPGQLQACLDVLRQAEQAFRAAANSALEANARYASQRKDCLAEMKQEGDALEEKTTRFPAWTVRAWWEVLKRPWRWLSIWNLYRDIAEQAVMYADYHKAAWLLATRLKETGLQAAYYQALAEQTRDLGTQLHSFREALQAASPIDEGNDIPLHTITELLEAAALPAGITDHFYHRGYRSPTETLTLVFNSSMPLSGWWDTENGAQNLVQLLGEHAGEQFDFVTELRLDTLLVHTYNGIELRARLAELLAAAAPFWHWQGNALDPEDRLSTVQQAWVGLPHVDDSPLADLVPERSVDCYDRADPGVITAVQLCFSREQPPDDPC